MTDAELTKALHDLLEQLRKNRQSSLLCAAIALVVIVLQIIVIVSRSAP